MKTILIGIGAFNTIEGAMNVGQRAGLKGFDQKQNVTGSVRYIKGAEVYMFYSESARQEIGVHHDELTVRVEEASRELLFNGSYEGLVYESGSFEILFTDISDIRTLIFVHKK